MTDGQAKKRIKTDASAPPAVVADDPETWPKTGVWEEVPKLTPDQKDMLPYIIGLFLEHDIPLTFPLGQTRDEGPYPTEYDPKARDHCAFWRSCNPIALSKWVMWAKAVDEPFRKFAIQLRTQSTYDPSKKVAVVWPYCLGKTAFSKPFPGGKFDTGTWDKSSYIIDPHFMPGPGGWPDEMLYSPKSRTMPALMALMVDIAFKVAKPLMRELVWRAGRDYNGERPCECKIPGLWDYWRKEARRTPRSPHKKAPNHDKELLQDARQMFMEAETMFFGVSKNELASDDPQKHRKFVAELNVFHHDNPKATLGGKGQNIDWGVYHSNKSDAETIATKKEQEKLIRGVRKEAQAAGFKINTLTFIVPVEDAKGNTMFVKKSSDEYELKRGSLISGGVLFAPKLVTKDDAWTVSCTLKNAGPVTVLFEPEEDDGQINMPAVEPWVAMARRKKKRMDAAPTSAATAPDESSTPVKGESSKDPVPTDEGSGGGDDGGDADADEGSGTAADADATMVMSTEPETQPFPDTPDTNAGADAASEHTSEEKSS